MPSRQHGDQIPVEVCGGGGDACTFCLLTRRDMAELVSKKTTNVEVGGRCVC